MLLRIMHAYLHAFGLICVLLWQGLQPAAWADALAAVKKGLEGVKGDEIKAIAGKLADAESMVALKVRISFLMCWGLLMHCDCSPLAYRRTRLLSSFKAAAQNIHWWLSNSHMLSL